MKSHTRPWETGGTPPPLSSLTKFCESFPKLEYLALVPVFILDDEILRFLSCFTGLRSLSLTPSIKAADSREDPDKFPVDISLSALNQLDTLRLSARSEGLLEWFQSSGWTPRLGTLEITLYRHHHKGWGPIHQLNLMLKQNRDSLEHLHVNVEYYEEVHERDESPDGTSFVLT
jgi:hypothetical protein